MNWLEWFDTILLKNKLLWCLLNEEWYRMDRIVDICFNNVIIFMKVLFLVVLSISMNCSSDLSIMIPIWIFQYYFLNMKSSRCIHPFPIERSVMITILRCWCINCVVLNCFSIQLVWNEIIDWILILFHLIVHDFNWIMIRNRILVCDIISGLLMRLNGLMVWDGCYEYSYLIQFNMNFICVVEYG